MDESLKDTISAGLLRITRMRIMTMSKMLSLPTPPDLNDWSDQQMQDFIKEHRAAVDMVEKAQALVEAQAKAIQVREQRIQEQRMWGLRVDKRLSETLGARYLTYEIDAIPKREALLKATSFIITGQRGAGKSMALTYALQERAVNMGRHDVTEIEAYKAPVLFTLFHNGGYPKEDAELFAIDDVGTEYGEPFALSQFQALVEFRYSHLLPMLITTNMTKVEFNNRAGWERISDRLLQMCSWIVFTGGSRRGLA